ncbi:MAG: transglutaminase domain-containing protein [Candidatus Omnitrophota bacterium]
MEGIIKETFREWTKGEATDRARVSVFEHIRDIPYAIDLKLFDNEKSSEAMIKKNKGFCVSKHYLLGVMFKELGIPVKYCSYPFRWSELKAISSDSLKAAAEKLPVTYHFACEAYIVNRWILIDATWDRALKTAGFPINDRWDGKSSMLNAVMPLKVSQRLGRRVESLSEGRAEEVYDFPEKLKLFRFSMMFNKWLSDLRENGDEISPLQKRW